MIRGGVGLCHGRVTASVVAALAWSVCAAPLARAQVVDDDDTSADAEGDADAKSDAATKQNGAAAVPHKEGEYGGVIPGEVSEDGKPRRMPSKPTLTWVGFQPGDGGASRVFLQMSVAPEYQQVVEGSELVITLVGLRYGGRNSRRMLDTRFFDTALARVTSKHVRKRRARRDKPGHPGGIELRVSFKNPADVRQAAAKLSQEADGYHYLYLDFGPGTPTEKADSEAGGDEVMDLD